MKKVLLITAFAFSCLQIQASEELRSDDQICKLGLKPTNTETEESTVNNTKENSTLNDNTVAQLNDNTVAQLNEELSTGLQELNSMNYLMSCLNFLKQTPNFLDFLALAIVPITYYFDGKIMTATSLFTLSLFFSSAINIGSKKYLSNHITNSDMIEKNIRCLDIAMVGSLVSFCFLIALDACICSIALDACICSIALDACICKQLKTYNAKGLGTLNIPTASTLAAILTAELAILTAALNLGSFIFKSYKLRKKLENKRQHLIKNKQETKEELPLPSKA